MLDVQPYDFTYYDFVGISGVCLYLGSYAALQIGLIRGKGFLYPTLNGLAASCVLVSLIPNFHLSSAVIQIAWIVISAAGMAKVCILARHARSNGVTRVNPLADLANPPECRTGALRRCGAWAIRGQYDPDLRGRKGHLIPFPDPR